MNRHSGWILVTLGFAALTPVVSEAARVILSDSSAAASTTYQPVRAAKYAVNGAGLTDDQHTNIADNVAWMSGTQSTTVSGQWFRVDLGQIMPLDHFKLWNFNFWHATVATTNRGIRNAEVYLSSLGTTPGTDFTDPSQWTRVIDTVTFAKAPGSNAYTGEPDVPLQGYEARWLALRVLSNYSSTDFTVGISELQVFAGEKPVAMTVPPTEVSPTRATLSGVLTFDGGFATTVFAYWGTTDGGAVSSAWDHVVCLGVQPVGALGTNVSVSADGEYYFRFHAISVSGESWSDAGGFLTAPVAVELPSRVSEGSGAVPVTFRRPAALTNTSVTVTFDVSGDTLANEDYMPFNPSVVIPAGAETAQALITLVDDLAIEPDETLTVGLGPSACVRTAASTNSTTIADDDGQLDTSAWLYHMNVSLSGYNGAETLTNFPFVLRLHEGLAGFRYSDFALPSTGGDLRITDATTGQTLTYEIETWNPLGTSVVWACVSELKGPSTALRLHWGNAQASLPGYTTGGITWHSEFGGVWHLRTPAALDSTVNTNNGTAHGNVTVPGILGSGQFFNGTSYIQVPDSASIGTNTIRSLTLSMWFKSDATLFKTNETWRMLEKGDGYFFGQGFGSAGGMVFILKQNNGAFGAGNGAEIASNEWHHACGTYDGSVMRLYIDGVQKGTGSLAAPIDDDKLPLRIGSDDSGKYFFGTLDETRVENVPRSANWVKACYESQKENSTFAVYAKAVLILKGTLINVF